MFKKLRDAGVCDLRVMDGVGIEKFAEYCHTVADKYVQHLTEGRCRCVKVEVFEHENNSAIYTMSKEDEDWLDVPVDDEQVEKPVEDEFSVPEDNQAPILTEEQMEDVMTEVVKADKRAKAADVNTNSSKTTNKWINPESNNSWGI